MTDKEIIEAAVKQIVAVMAKNKPYLFLLDELVVKDPNGTINVTLRVYRGFVTDVVVNKNTRFSLKPPTIDIPSK